MTLRTWIVALVLTAFWASCSDEVVERGGEYTSSIRFATVLTKGGAITNAEGVAHAGGFNVWAYRNSEATYYMNGILVTSADGNTWEYDEPLNWPGGNVSFYAYAPAGSAEEVVTTSGIPQLTYIVPTDPTQQKDLLIATPLTESNGTVALQFNHALSKISFSALMASEDDSRETFVKKIQLSHIYNKGTIAMDEEEWAVDEEDTAYTVEIGKGLENIKLGATTQNISDKDNLLFLMPQEINRTTGEQVQMSVTLLINGGETTYTAPVFSPDKWEPGKSYNYQISVDHGSIKVIEIGTGSNLSLTDWDAKIIIQSVIMPNVLRWNVNNEVNNRFYAGLNNLDSLKASSKASSYSWFLNYKWFGLYATNDVNGELTLNVSGNHSFVKGDYVIFDFKKAVDEWGVDANEKPYTVTVDYDKNEWKLSDAFQYSDKIPKNLLKVNFDGSTGATLPLTFKGSDNKDTTIYPSASITGKGAIILEHIKDE